MDYRAKLGISFNDSNKAKRLKNQLFNSLANCGDIFWIEDERIYASELGVKCLSDDYAGGIKLSFIKNAEKRPFTIAYVYFQDSDAIADIISKFVALINITDGSVSSFLKDRLEESLKDSLIDYEIYEDDEGVYYFPKGAPELDKPLVTDVLGWLQNYEKSYSSYVYALNEYANLSEESASSVVDSFRKALETFFQEFFNSKKSLENLKSEYGQYLKDKGIPKEIASNFESLLQAYIQFNNNYAKHHNESKKNVVEYILYQTGNIIRLLVTLSQ